MNKILRYKRQIFITCECVCDPIFQPLECDRPSVEFELIYGSLSYSRDLA